MILNLHPARKVFMKNLKPLNVEYFEVPEPLFGNNSFTVLTIDDDINNLKIIENHLKDNGYNAIFARDGNDGLKLFRENKDKIDVILLDKMMPNMNGIEFIKLARADSSLPKVPIIMQTAAADAASMQEGFKAGIFYYLTKPFEGEILLSIVQAAASDYLLHESVRKDVRKQKNTFGLIYKTELEFQNLEEAKSVAAMISNLFPDPERVILGLSEIMINAVEHGNLELGYDKKTELINNGKWEEEIIHRLSLEKNKNKKVQVLFEKNNERASVLITDRGKGFNWNEYMTISAERMSHNHGRGIAMANQISFDSMEYLGCGNSVRCSVNLKQNPDTHLA